MALVHVQSMLAVCSAMSVRALCDVMQVRHRCRCQNLTICGEEARMVEHFALLGQLVPNAQQEGGPS